jgi:hypothetical protein
MPTPEPQYTLDEAGRFTIQNYNWAKPFSNFFPGIAGKWGIPMWIFYVSRGQGICSIGVHDKDHAITEFLSFNKALQVVDRQGFRTFLRVDDGTIHEPFRKVADPAIEQTMTVSSHELEIRERQRELELETTVTYYPLANLPLAGLIRRVSITNTGSQTRQLELIDGLPKILPYGVTFEHVKVIARHIEGMMGAFEVAGVPLFRLKQTPGDVEQVAEISGGNFYLSVDEAGEMLGEQTIVDPYVVFAEQEVHDEPWGFVAAPLDDLIGALQVRENRTPSALTALRRDIPAGETLTIHSIVGFAPSDEALARFAEQASQPTFFDRQRVENQRVIEQIKHTAFTVSGEPAFDQYVQQTFLDNVMRGGMPLTFESGDDKSVFYIYARQNGDLERDYHWFVLEPTYLSQGNGHYRSILQNRRMDGWFFPEIEDFNLTTYLNLIQTDGYNPLVVNGFSYTVEDEETADRWIRTNIPSHDREQLLELVRGSFTPGEFVGALEALGEPIERPNDELLAELLGFCSTNEIADLHEGFWQDHWFYNLDTIDTFRTVYPDRWLEVLLERRIYSYFDDPDVVQPRHRKTLFVGSRVRQYGAVVRDEQKQALIEARERDAYQLRTENGAGSVYRSNLLVKLLCILANRVASLDREGIGVEMEAGKPGWLDSLNGLPGIFGSSLNETLELERACQLLLESLTPESIPVQPVYEELGDFVHGLNEAMRERLTSSDAYGYWERSQSLKETYRERTRLGIHGEETDLTRDELVKFLNNCLSVIQAALDSGAIYDGAGVPHTYYISNIVKYEFTKADFTASGDSPVPVRPLAHEHRPMAPFLEGPVHMLRVHPEEAPSVYDAVRDSELFDRELQMYRCCTWLRDEPLEIGRIKSYARGWIENESIYTHMEYKWLLEVLRSGLHEEFFNDVQHALAPFMDPAIYGRSPLENCSFIASSVFPDRRSHGRAFQPRLSGVTCEMLNIWTLMVAGERPFYLDSNRELALRLQPILHERFFTKEPITQVYWDASGEQQSIEVPENCFAFKFLGHTLVIYSNPDRRSTFGEGGVRPVEYSLTSLDRTVRRIQADALDQSLAEEVRVGRFSRMDVLLR